MDALSEVLRVSGLAGAVLADATAGGNWCVAVPASSTRAFAHVVLEGECSLKAGDAEAIALRTGDAAFLVGATDAKAMGGAILALLVQPDYARQIANRGLARAREFSWRKTAEGTLAVYTQALAR